MRVNYLKYSKILLYTALFLGLVLLVTSTVNAQTTCERCSFNNIGCWATWTDYDGDGCAAPTVGNQAEFDSVSYSPAGCETGTAVDPRCIESNYCERCSNNYPGCWSSWFDFDGSGCAQPTTTAEYDSILYTPGSCIEADGEKDPRCDKPGLNVDYPEIPIQNGTFDLNAEYNSGNITVASIMLFLYAASIWVAGILAFVALIYAGFIFIISGDNPGTRARAKRQFSNVLWGLLIVLLVPVILNYINPTTALLDDPNLLNVDPGEGEFKIFQFFGDAGDNRFDLTACLEEGNTIEYCQSECVTYDNTIEECSEELISNSGDGLPGISSEEDLVLTTQFGCIDQGAVVRETDNNSFRHCLFSSTQEAENWCNECTSSKFGGQECLTLARPEERGCGYLIIE